MKKSNQLKFLAICCVASFLTACGGGGSSSSSNTASGSSSSPSQLTGTVAVGAPLVNATVMFLDANNTASSTANVNADGTYTLPTTGLTPPYIIKASGYIGGTQVNLYSTATSASQVANVTPLTHAVTMLATATAPEQIFSGSAQLPTVATLNTALSSATTTVQNSISSAITAVNGASAVSSTDFIQSAFTANHTGMDKVLDYLQINPTFVNSGSQVVPSMNISNSTGTGFVNVLANGTVSGSLGASSTFLNYDVSGIETLLSQISTLVSTGNYNSSSWSSVTDSSFLDGGKSLSQFLAGISGSLPSGAQISSSFVPKTCKSVSGNIICDIEGTVLKSDGGIFTTFKESLIQRGGTGSWKMYGNQAPASFQVQTYIEKFIRLDGVTLSPSQTYVSGLHFDIEQPGTAVQSAQFFIVQNGTPLTNPVIQLKQQSGCTYMGLVDANGNATCSNMLALDGNTSGTSLSGITTLNTINQTFQNGGAFFRLVMYSDANYSTAIATIDNIPLDGGLPLPALAGAQMTFPTLDSTSIATLTNYTSGVGQSFQLSANANVTVNNMHVTVVGNSLVDDNGGSNDTLISSNKYQINLSSAPSGVTSSSYRSVYLGTPTAMYIGTKYLGCGGGTCW